MIKINLLPAHVLERRQVRRLMWLFLILVVAVIIPLVAASLYLKWKASLWDEQATAYQGLANRVRQVKAEADQLTADAAPLQDWVNFANDVDTHNKDYAKVLAEIARYLHPRATLKSLEISDAAAVTLIVNVDKPSTAGQTWLNLRRCPALNGVNVKEMPGWSGGEWGGWQPLGSETGTPSTPLPVTMPGTTPSGTTYVQVSARREFEVTFTATLTPNYTPKPASPPGGAPAAAGVAPAGGGPAPMGAAPGGAPTPEGAMPPPGASRPPMGPAGAP